MLADAARSDTSIRDFLNALTSVIEDAERSGSGVIAVAD